MKKYPRLIQTEIQNTFRFNTHITKILMFQLFSFDKLIFSAQ